MASKPGDFLRLVTSDNIDYVELRGRAVERPCGLFRPGPGRLQAYEAGGRSPESLAPYSMVAGGKSASK